MKRVSARVTSKEEETLHIRSTMEEEEEKWMRSKTVNSNNPTLKGGE